MVAPVDVDAAGRAAVVIDPRGRHWDSYLAGATRPSGVAGEGHVLWISIGARCRPLWPLPGTFGYQQQVTEAPGPMNTLSSRVAAREG